MSYLLLWASVPLCELSHCLVRLFKGCQVLDDIDQVLSVKLLLQVGRHERDGLLLQAAQVVALQLMDDRLGGLDFDCVVGLADEDAADHCPVERLGEPRFVVDAHAGARIENRNVHRFFRKLAADLRQVRADVLAFAADLMTLGARASGGE